MFKHGGGLLRLAACLVALLAVLPYSKVKAQKQHPYLFYTDERVQYLKKRMASDTAIGKAWEEMKAGADKMLQNSEDGNMETLALAYRVTGNVQYAIRAKALLNGLLNRDAWDAMDDRTPRWNAGLATSHTNFTASVVYDAIYPALTTGERKEMAGKIFRLGIEPSVGDWLNGKTRMHSLNSMGHNWWAAVVFEAGVASLAVMQEIPEAKSLAQQVMDDSEEWFAFAGSVLENKPASFDEAGGFYESVSYANYAVGEYLLFRLAYTQALARTSMPYDSLLQQTMHWFMHACYPRNGQLMSLNFGDSNDFANAARPIKLMIALGLEKPEYYWYLGEIAKKQGGDDMGLQTPMGLLYQPGNHATSANPQLPPSAMFGNMGWAMLRSAWQQGATLLGVKCGYTWNHAHADAGSFVLYHNGENLLIDGGDAYYGSDAYSDYFVTSRAHNVVLFNGQGQDAQDQYHAVKTPGRLYNLLDGGFVKYILADAAGPTARNFLRNFRSFLWVGNVILVIDDLHSYEPGNFEFLLHYQDTAIKKGPDFEITKGPASILFRPLYPETLPLGYPHDFPEKMQYKTEYGLKDRTTDVKIPYYKLYPAEKTDRTKLVNAIILLDSSNQAAKTFTGSSGANGAPGRTNLPVIERFQGNDYLGLRITQQGVVSEVYINLLADGRLMHRNANNNMNGWETDAYITVINYPQTADAGAALEQGAVFVANGSYLRKNGQVLLSSLSKVFAYAGYNHNALQVLLQGQPVINLLLQPARTIRLQVNGKPAPVTRNGEGMLAIHATAVTP